MPPVHFHGIIKFILLLCLCVCHMIVYFFSIFGNIIIMLLFLVPVAPLFYGNTTTYESVGDADDVSYVEEEGIFY